MQRYEYKFVRLESSKNWLAGTTTPTKESRKGYPAVVHDHATEGWRLAGFFNGEAALMAAKPCAAGPLRSLRDRRRRATNQVPFRRGLSFPWPSRDHRSGDAARMAVQSDVACVHIGNGLHHAEREIGPVDR